MNTGLLGRTALVTGSSGGIGAEIAFQLASEGARIIVHGRDSEKVSHVCSKIKRMYAQEAYAFVADGTKAEDLEKFFKTTMRTIGKLDILVNNMGGVVGKKRFQEVTDEEWYQAFTFNFMGAVRFTRLALPFLKNSDQARIINLATAPALQPGFNNPHYSASKAALVNWSKYISNDFAEYGILVNAICPNTILGGAWNRDIKNISETENLTPQEAYLKLVNITKSKVPLKRVGQMNEVASLVVFLASQQASFINGECIFVDGGTKRSIF